MLTGMTGSTQVEGTMVSLTVKSMDESTVTELPNVKTVKGMPISPSCIPKCDDLSRCGLTRWDRYSRIKKGRSDAANWCERKT